MTVPVPMSSFAAHVPLDLDHVIASFPTLSATEPHHSRSARYTHVETSEVLRGLYSEGFRVHSVSTARFRDASKAGFEKHMVRLRHVDAKNVGGSSPEVVITNSHDGSSRFIAMGGIIRFICSNGLIVGDMIQSVRIKHMGDIVDNVVTATHAISKQVSDVFPVIDAMRSLELSDAAREEFAHAAHAIRFPRDAETGEHHAPVSPLALLGPRRFEDTGRDLWSTFNVVQENMIRGGLQGRIMGSNGRMRRASLRAVNGIDGSIDVNRRLFNLANETRERLAA